MTYNFINDYSMIAHPLVLEKLLEASKKQYIGYGYDEHTKRAIKKIRDEIQNQTADVFFLAGGTQTNLTLISGILRPYEGVICASTGHINVHETGAIEGTGHKCLVADSVNGKLTVEGIEDVLKTHIDEHMVKPKMVYISNATELGGVYTLDELKELHEVCQKNGLYLYLDGARLASALAYPNKGVTMKDIAKYCDAFYIGGTKNGGYIGEALVLINDKLKPDFKFHVKHCGALLAKGYVAAIVFEALFEDNLYYKIGEQQNRCAQYLCEKMKGLGYTFSCESTTNQIFVQVSREQKEYIAKEYGFEIWESITEEDSIIRLVTSFDTTIDICNKFIDYLQKK